MSKFVAGHVTKIWHYLFLHTNFALKLQGKCWKDDVVMFTAHLSETIKHLTRYKQKVVLATMLEGESMSMRVFLVIKIFFFLAIWWAGYFFFPSKCSAEYFFPPLFSAGFFFLKKGSCVYLYKMYLHLHCGHCSISSNMELQRLKML